MSLTHTTPIDDQKESHTKRADFLRDLLQQNEKHFFEIIRFNERAKPGNKTVLPVGFFYNIKDELSDDNWSRLSFTCRQACFQLCESMWKIECFLIEKTTFDENEFIPTEDNLQHVLKDIDIEKQITRMVSNLFDSHRDSDILELDNMSSTISKKSLLGGDFSKNFVTPLYKISSLVKDEDSFNELSSATLTDELVRIALTNTNAPAKNTKGFCEFFLDKLFHIESAVESPRNNSSFKKKAAWMVWETLGLLREINNSRILSRNNPYEIMNAKPLSPNLPQLSPQKYTVYLLEELGKNMVAIERAYNRMMKNYQFFFAIAVISTVSVMAAEESKLLREIK